MDFDKYKANYLIFLEIPKIDMGGAILRGFYWNDFERESKMYLINSKDELVKKYLPYAYVETEEDARKQLIEYSKRLSSKAGIQFCVATKDKQIPFGYVLCHSPLVRFQDSNEPSNDWNIDFWLSKETRGQGIMTVAVINTLMHLQKMEVPRVYAYVNKENKKSIELLKRCNMMCVDETYDKKMFKYGIRLKNKDIPL